MAATRRRPEAGALCEAVIFDMDGLMLDSERLAIECWLAESRRLGWTIDETVCRGLVGLDPVAAQRLLSEHLDASFPLQAVGKNARQAYQRQVRARGIALKPGLATLLDWLETHDVPKAVATSTRRTWAQEKLALAGIDSRFTILVGGDEIGHGKPAPDIYLEAARQIGVEPARCLALEDTDTGLRAATAAGMSCILVPDLRPPAEEFSALAHAIVPSLQQALPLIQALLGKSAHARRT